MFGNIAVIDVDRYIIQSADGGVHLFLETVVEGFHGTELIVDELSGHKEVKKGGERKKNQTGNRKIGKEKFGLEFGLDNFHVGYPPLCKKW